MNETIFVILGMIILTYVVSRASYDAGRSRGMRQTEEGLRNDTITIPGIDSTDYPLVGADCPLHVFGPHYKVHRVGFAAEEDDE